ncbi:Acyl-CoA synthetase (NDP forming) [Paenibacillus sp. yr247]|uniref:acetate--CoA ligase family protein n=1 Tax=Paenibacillus sp. yr247 TaxID=1761880 RepID=UPI0008905C2E|nr:acetate--CoA ligase family protein [Paenibacillus sp. yr247]SDO49466.1 Acyl-CoA synthetase (NDP forming) [Paenibacillus sp. yr247]
MNKALHRMLNPISIAVVGASEKMNYGGRLMKNLLQQGYEGQLFPVNPSSKEIFGIPSYPSLDDIAADIDLAVLIVKAEAIESLLEQCETKKVGSVLIISAGFREQGTEEGERRELMLTAWSQRTGIPICGPNCLGIGSSAAHMWANSASSIGESKLSGGSVGLISHSGATAFGPLLNRAKDYGVGYRYIVSTGNEASVSMTQFADFMLDDPDVKAVGLFIEGIKDGKAFAKLADKALRLGKPIITLKIGESAVGQKAAASHTASMTGDQQVFEAFCRQKGILAAKDYEEFIALVKCCEYSKPLKGCRFAVLSHSGGIGGFVGDKMGAAGLSVPHLQAETVARIDTHLTGFGTANNPLDLSGTMQTEQIIEIHAALEGEAELEGIVYATHGKAPLTERLGALDRSSNKPLYWLWTGSLEDPELQEVKRLPVPLFFNPKQLASTLSRLLEFYERSRDASSGNSIISSKALDGAAQLQEFIKQTGSLTLTELEGKQVLQSVGISVPDHYYLPVNGDLSSFLQTISFKDKRYVAKLVSRTITHKSDSGGVALNLKQPDQVKEFFENRILQSTDAAAVDGMLLEEMVGEKVELILGSTNDPQFGPVILIGLGGVLTELFQLVTWRVAPIDKEEAKRMLGEIKGLLTYLQGYRNMPETDIEALLQTLETFSHWVYEQQDLVESVEINPLAVLPKGQGVKALDCVITLKSTSEQATNSEIEG